MTYFYYRAEAEKASEESLTLPNGEFANKIACTEQEYALVSQQAADWCFYVRIIHATFREYRVEMLDPENCILKDGQLYAYYYASTPCVICLQEPQEYLVREETDEYMDSHDRKYHTRTTQVYLLPCFLTQEGLAIRDKFLFWCRRDAAGTVRIPEGVERIGSQAFENCSQITEMIFPRDLQRVEEDAFCNCTGLVSVTLPDKAYINRNAFRGCDNITKIQGNNIPGIEWQAFRHTAFWNDPANRKDGVLYIGSYLVDAEPEIRICAVLPGTEGIHAEAFKDCEKLTEVVLPDTLKAIGEGAFRNCRMLTRITLPHTVTKIACSVFSHCISLHTAMLSPDTKVIDDYAFYHCENLTSIQLPDGLEELSYSAFSSCKKLRSISLPGSLRLIGATVFAPEQTKNVFENCPSLETVTAQPGTYADRYIRRHRLG